MAEEKKIPDEFIKVVKDFIEDLKVTFPEYNSLINKWWKTIDYYNYIENEEERIKEYELFANKSASVLFDFCQKKIPPRFFDILYQNEDIFKSDSDVDTEFLPNIHFKNLWQCDITDKTRETIWKYLQLITFSIIGTIHNKDAFGDTANLFEAINEEDFKSKLEETLSHINNFFDFDEKDDNSGLREDLGGDDGSGLGSNSSDNEKTPKFNKDDLPNIEKIQEHINGMMDGKLGKIKKEISEETASSLNMDFENTTDMKDLFNNLIKNPTKLMGLVKTIGSKLDSKLKSGDIKESELMSEAGDIMNKMKNMPGMNNIQSILSKMGLSGLGGKVNTSAMESQLNSRMKLAKTKERIRAKAEANQKAKLEEQMKNVKNVEESLKQTTNKISEEELLKLFSSGEKPERTPRKDTDGKKKKKK
jgi:hypothetical protein